MIRDIRFRSKEEFLDAAELLVELRGRFTMLPGNVLSVNEEQFAALVKAGLVTANSNKGRRRGSRKAQTKKPGKAAR